MKHKIMLLIAIPLILFPFYQSLACTGITLRAEDGAVVFGRTLEWGSFDLKSRIMIVPRGYKFVGQTPEGANGIRWTAQYGVAGIDMTEKPIIADGMNEKGLAVGVFYHPGYAEYRDYDASLASKSLAPTEVALHLLTTCASVDDVREAIHKVTVVNVVEPTLGIPAQVHLMVTDPTGKQIVIEWKGGEAKIFDAPLGVITNAPTYDWHITNLRNYINLSPVALPTKHISDLDFAPLGGGSGMIGLPGDYTPPSRFVRAVALSKTARPTIDGPETIYELFRILDNFNVPLGAAEAGGEHNLKGMRSSTIWTTGNDTKNKVIYYHTQHNRQVRKIEIKRIDFSAFKKTEFFPLDVEKAQMIVDRTPQH